MSGVHVLLESGRSDLDLNPCFVFPGGSDGRISLQCRRPRFDPWLRKIPWRREWLSTPVSLAGEVHGQRSLVGCSPWGRKESDTTEQLTHIVFH